MSEARAILREFSARTGWNEETMLELACQYIDNQSDSAGFEDFLAEQERDENSETDNDDGVTITSLTVDNHDPACTGCEHDCPRKNQKLGSAFCSICDDHHEAQGDNKDTP